MVNPVAFVFWSYTSSCNLASLSNSILIEGGRKLYKVYSFNVYQKSCSIHPNYANDDINHSKSLLTKTCSQIQYFSCNTFSLILLFIFILIILINLIIVVMWCFFRSLLQIGLEKIINITFAVTWYKEPQKDIRYKGPKRISNRQNVFWRFCYPPFKIQRSQLSILFS